jgi:hypothetical protein
MYHQLMLIQPHQYYTSNCRYYLTLLGNAWSKLFTFFINTARSKTSTKAHTPSNNDDDDNSLLNPYCSTILYYKGVSNNNNSTLK